MSWWTDLGLSELLPPGRLWAILRSLAVIVAGLVLARLAAAAVAKGMGPRIGAQNAMIARRFVYWGLFALVFATALHQLGFQLGVLLGAAGVLTVAVGFASQTSASNLISGVFLIAERPFVVGDILRLGDLTGEVLSIDALSVKIRTFDNLYVRVPNEELIRTRIWNLTRFPLRRVDVKVGVAYREDLDHVRRVLFGVADRNPLSLEDPAPLFIFTGFGESSLDLQFSVWGARENFLALKNSIQEEIKRAFDEEGIEIPFPHRTIYAGSVTGPFPVRTVDGEESVEPGGPARGS
jgi:small-conductance mechanosensitive channel